VHGVRAVRAEIEVRLTDGPAGERRLAQLVLRRLEHDPLVQPAVHAVGVNAHDGVIRLEGRVASAAQHDRAVRLARETATVYAVDDRLSVDPSLEAPPRR
jgi:osmotically-inducible protein OsmY